MADAVTRRGGHGSRYIPTRSARFVRGVPRRRAQCYDWAVHARVLAVPALLVAAALAGGLAASPGSVPSDADPMQPPATTAPSAPPADDAPGSPAVSLRGRRLLVVGDSVALTLGGGIERWGARHGVVVRNAGALGCALIDGAHVRGYWGVAFRPPDSCRTAVTWPGVLADFRPDGILVLFGAWDVYDASWDGARTWSPPGSAPWDEHFERAAAAAIERLTATGARVLWLAPPCFHARSGDPAAGREWYDPERVAVQHRLATRVVPRAGVTVSTTIADRECPADLAARPDGVHFSGPGADAAAAALEAELVDLLRPGRAPTR